MRNSAKPASDPGIRFASGDGEPRRVQISLIAAAGLSATLAIILGFADLLDLPYRDEHGIVGWVSSHQYPKYQDLLLYFCSLALAVFLVILVYGAWRFLSSCLSRLLAHPLESTHLLTALGTLPLHLVWLRLDWLSERPRRWGFAILCLTMLFTLGLILLDRKFQFAPRVWLPRLPELRLGPGIWIRLRRSRWYLFASWFVIPLMLFAAKYLGPLTGAVDLLHEGERLAPLNQLNHGGIPYADVYVQHGLFFNVYAGYAATVLFESSLAAVRLMDGLLRPLGPVAVYLLALTVLRSGPLGAIALVLVVASSPNWVSPRILLGVVAIALVIGSIHGRYGLKVLRRTGRGWRAVLSDGISIVLAGVCTSLVFWYSVEIGVFTFAAITSLLFGVGFLQPELPSSSRRGLPLALYFGGAMLGATPVLLYFHVNNCLSDLVRNVYEQLAFHSGIWGLPYAHLSSAFDELLSHGNVLTPWSLLATKGLNWFFPPMFFMVSAAYLTYRWLCGQFWNSTGCLRYTLVLLAAVFYFITSLGRSSPNHLVFGSVLFYVALFIAIEQAAIWLWRGLTTPSADIMNRMWSFWMLLPIVFAVAYINTYADPWKGLRYQLRNPVIPLLRAPAALRSDGIPDEQRRHLRQVVDYIHHNTADNDTLFDFSNQPGYLYFADRPSPTRYFMVAYAGSPDQQRQIIEDLEKHRTPLVIYKTGRRDRIDGLANPTRHPLIADYLDKHYGEGAVVDGVTFLKRKQIP